MINVANYIKFGRGIGARWLLLYALVVAIILGISVKMLGNYAAPHLQSVADQLLPIKIENGVIVEPENVVKAVKLDIDELNEFPIILDTTIDTVDTLGLRDGIYIAKKAVYIVSREQTKIYAFKDSMYLPKGDYIDLFKTVSVYVAWVFGLFALVGLFVLYLALTAFYAIFAVVLSKACKIFLDYPAAMRMTSLVYIATSVLMAVLRISGIGTPLWLYFVAVIALQTIILKCMSKKEEPAKSVNKI